MINSTKILTINKNNNVPLSDNYTKSLHYFDSKSFEKIIKLLDSVTDVLFNNRQSLASRMLRHAEHEAIGAQFIRMISQRLNHDSILKQQVIEHATDEEKHAKLFASLAEKLKSDGDTDYIYKYDIEKDIDEFNGDIDLFFISTHAAEIRNLFILDAYMSQVHQNSTHLPSSFFKAIEVIQHDEINHVSYTQEIVSELVKNESHLHYFNYCINDYEHLLLSEMHTSIVVIMENNKKSYSLQDVMEFDLV